MLYLLSQRTKYGCLGWVRTSGMSESKSDALPLGYEAILKWWGDVDLNHGTRRNRFTVCRVWPLRYLPIIKWCRQRESNPQPTDSYYYSFHYHFHVCSLDFLLTISFDLGPSYKVSTLKVYPLARDWHILILSFPRISDVHYNYFQLQVQDSSKSISFYPTSQLRCQLRYVGKKNNGGRYRTRTYDPLLVRQVL